MEEGATSCAILEHVFNILEGNYWRDREREKRDQKHDMKKKLDVSKKV